MRVFLTELAMGIAISAVAIGGALADAIKVGGERGDYNRHFAPALQNVLKQEWFDYPVELGAGTPDSMTWLVEHPKGVAFLQGNVFAELVNDPAMAGKIEVLRKDIAQEVVIAVMSPDAYQRSKGSWSALASRAARVRFVTSGENSGPGYTMRQLMELDPEGLGKANTAEMFVDNIDVALSKVANGGADVALMVQFANLDNPRFKFIAENKLQIVPVVDRSMKGLKLPDGSPAFEYCQGVQVQKKWLGLVGKDRIIDTACTPMLYATGAQNGEPDVVKVIAEATREDLLPADDGFKALIARVQAVTGPALEQAWNKASELGSSIAAEMR